MSLGTTADLLDALRRYRLLDATQLAAVVGSSTEPRALARNLVARGWLTPFQVNALFQSRGDGLLLGSYVLLDKLGEGGMGAVFKARNWKLGPVVALKLVRKERLQTDAALKRFQREVRAAAKLDHPYIVKALDADEVHGIHFLVMEFVDGQPLNRVVKERGPLPIAEACDLIRQAALGLQHAHERGLVHRDIKPHNLLLTRSTVKVADFGLALVGDEAGEESSTTLTREGAVMGTLDYIAPEQALDSHAVDIRADLYSLGCTLYFLLSGRVPFPGGEALAKLMKHRTEEPVPVEQWRPDVPPAVAAVIRKLMAKRPEDRFQTPEDLARALQTLGTPAVLSLPGAKPPSPAGGDPTWEFSVTTPDKPKPSSLRGRLAWTGFALAVVAGAAVLAAWVSWPKPSPTSPGETTPAPKLAVSAFDRLRREDIPPELLTAAGSGQADKAPPEIVAIFGPPQVAGPVLSLALSPDGRTVALGTKTGRVVLVEVGTGKTDLLQVPGEIRSLQFSRNGRLLAVGSKSSDVRLWELSSGLAVQVLSTQRYADDFSFAFLPDDRAVAYGSSHSAERADPLALFKITPRGPTPPPTPLASAKSPSNVTALALNPEGTILAAANSQGTSWVKLWDLRAPETPRMISEKGRNSSALAFTTNGQRLLVARMHQSPVVLHEVATGAEVGRYVGHAGDRWVTDLAVHPDGQRIASSDDKGGVRIWNVDSLQDEWSLDFSAIGGVRKVLFALDGRHLLTRNQDGTVFVLRLPG